MRRSQRLSPDERITRRAEYQQVYQRGSKNHGRFFTLFILPTAGRVTRLGIAATKKLGDAVRRNRAKRIVREIFRRRKVVPGYDIVVVPRPEILDANFGSVESDYESMLNKRRVRPS